MQLQQGPIFDKLDLEPTYFTIERTHNTLEHCIGPNSPIVTPTAYNTTPLYSDLVDSAIDNVPILQQDSAEDYCVPISRRSTINAATASVSQHDAISEKATCTDYSVPIAQCSTSAMDTVPMRYSTMPNTNSAIDTSLYSTIEDSAVDTVPMAQYSTVAVNSGR